MKSFVIQGEFKAGRRWESFTRTVESQNEKNAAEKTYSVIGSRHRLKRNLIRINKIEEVAE